MELGEPGFGWFCSEVQKLSGIAVRLVQEQMCLVF